jgi:hypothetical protein
MSKTKRRIATDTAFLLQPDKIKYVCPTRLALQKRVSGAPNKKRNTLISNDLYKNRQLTSERERERESKPTFCVWFWEKLKCGNDWRQ